MKKKPTISIVCKYFILILVAVISLYPIVWLVLSSVKTNDELLSDPWGLPKIFQFSNYIYAWTISGIGKSFINSLIVSFFSLFLALLISSMASFALTRMQWKGAKVVTHILLVGMMIPIHATLIPLFLVFSKVGLVNNYLGLILPYVTFALPISVFILTAFFRSFPEEIEESAIIDGASMYRVFFGFVLPVSRPAMATVAIYNFVHMWNELVYALVFMNDRAMTTLPVSLSVFKGQDSTNYVWLLAAISIATLPSIVVYIIFNHQIIAGMTSGAVKG